VTLLWDIATKFNQVPAKEVGDRTPLASAAASIRPGDELNEKGKNFIRRILQKHGWTCIGEANDNDEIWRRPGKNSGSSARLHHTPPTFHVFSTDAPPFETISYSYFAVYAILEHNGDFTAASKELALQGFGDTLSTQPVELPEFISDFPADLEDGSAEIEGSEIGESDECPEHFPEHLLRVPGFVSELAQYINSASHVDQPTYSLASALAFQALLCAQNVKDPTGIRTNPYIIVAGLSSSGKDKGREIIKKIFTQIQNDAKNHFHETLDLITERVASYQALENWLHANKGIGLWLWDEIGKELPTFLTIDHRFYREYRIRS
jgi:hypothetical protein